MSDHTAGNPLDKPTTNDRDQLANLIEASRQIQTDVIQIKTRIQEDWSIINGRLGAQERELQALKDVVSEYAGSIPRYDREIDIIKQKVEDLTALQLECQRMVKEVTNLKRGRPKKVTK